MKGTLSLSLLSYHKATGGSHELKSLFWECERTFVVVRASSIRGLINKEAPRCKGGRNLEEDGGPSKVEDAVGGAFAFGGGQPVRRPPERVKLTLHSHQFYYFLLHPQQLWFLSYFMLLLHALSLSLSGIPTQHYRQLKNKE